MVGLIIIALQLYSLVIITRSLFSFFPITEGTPAAKVYDVVYAMTEPVLAPIRGLIGPVGFAGGALDLSPLIVLLAIIVLTRVLGG